MKPSATLVNGRPAARVDTQPAFVEALNTRPDRRGGSRRDRSGALPRNHPLLQMSNVVITPHLGSATYQTRRKMAERSVANLLAGIHGGPLPHAVRYPPSVAETMTRS